MKITRREYGVTFKAQFAVAGTKGDKTLAELAEQFSVQPACDSRLVKSGRAICGFCHRTQVR